MLSTMRSQHRSRMGLLALTVLLATAALAGCAAPAQGTSSIYVKDALTDDVAEVYVTFTKAQVKAEGGGWTTVYEGKKTIELLSLSAADAREELASFDIPPGAYDGLRVAVSEVTVIDHDGNETLLNTYGNVVSIAEDFTVGDDGIDILIDFDLEAGVDLEAGTYTPVVGDVQTSDDDSDGDGVDDVRDEDDDDDGLDDAEDDDDDGDGHHDGPRQHHGSSGAELCAAERDEELHEAEEERNETLADAERERDEELAEDNLTREDRAEAWGEYNVTVAEAEAEYDEEVAEAHDEYDECLVEDDHDARDEDDHDERDEDGRDEDDHGEHDHDGDDHEDDHDEHDEEHDDHEDDHDEHDEEHDDSDHEHDGS